MAQASKASRRTLLNKYSSDLPIGTYFVSGQNLYHIEGYMNNEDLTLLEDCYTNKRKWVASESLTRTRKEVIKPK